MILCYHCKLAKLFLSTQSLGVIQKLCQTFVGNFDPLPHVSHTVTCESTHLQILCHTETNQPLIKNTPNLIHAGPTCYANQKNSMYLSMLSIDCPLCKTKYVKQQMGH